MSFTSVFVSLIKFLFYCVKNQDGKGSFNVIHFYSTRVLLLMTPSTVFVDFRLKKNSWVPLCKRDREDGTTNLWNEEVVVT